MAACRECVYENTYRLIFIVGLTIDPLRVKQLKVTIIYKTRLKHMIAVSVVGKIELNCPFEKALHYIQALENISDYEPKISQASTSVTDSRHGTYSTVGFFSCVPWRGQFEYSLHDHGFHSVMVGGVMADAMQGGFAIFPIDGNRCQLWHYEEYRFPPVIGRLLKPGWRCYLDYAMKNELLDIEEHLISTVEKNSTLDVTLLDKPILSEVVKDVDWEVLFDKIQSSEERQIKIASSTTL